MKMTDLANEVCYRLGEGYQNFQARAIVHLTKAFNDIILSGNATEDEYFGLIYNYTDTITEDKIAVNDITNSNIFDILKIISLFVGTTKYDQIDNIENERLSYLSNFIENAYYFNNGNLYLIGASGVSFNISIRIVKVYKEASPTPLELNNYFTNSFLDKALDVAMKSLYNEINA